MCEFMGCSVLAGRPPPIILVTFYRLQNKPIPESQCPGTLSDIFDLVGVWVGMGGGGVL